MDHRLSPVLNGFRSLGGRGELTIIYCGTGLSIKTLHWALSSGDGVKEFGSSTFPYIEFPGWTDPNSVQAFIDRMKEHLQDDESKRVVDELIPRAAVNMLHKRLTGRLRPITTGKIFLSLIEKNHNAGNERCSTLISQGMGCIFYYYYYILNPAIEGIIKTGIPSKWETVIDLTETMITSWKELERRGNLCGELKR